MSKIMQTELHVSIIIPCFNEKETIVPTFESVKSTNFFKKEIIIVDDCSSDGSTEIIKDLKENNPNLKVIFHSTNLGKGAAIKSGLKVSSGDLILIQDADLEYSPSDYQILIEPFLKYEADVVYGSRFVGGNGPKRLHLFWHTVANKLLTLITNFFTNLNMTDMETGYKVFKKKFINPDDLKENSFSFCPEVTTKISNLNEKIIEVPINYNGREYKDGKKIKIYDGFDAIKALFLYKFFKKK